MTQKLVLVAYGSRRGGTEGIAQWIGDELRTAQLAVEVRPAGQVRAVDAYDAVVLGGAIYSGRWHREARSFVRRFGKRLRTRPVWVFGSGPLDRSAEDPGSRVSGARAVARAAGRLGARGQVLFGGRLAADAEGFPASAIAKKMAGDFRDEGLVRAWAKDIATQL